MYRPSSAKAASSTSPGSAADARSGAAREAGARWPTARAGGRASGGRRRPATPSMSAAQAMPSSTCSAWSWSGLTSMSTMPSGRAAHRADVGDVRDDRGRAGAERIGAHERRRDRLAADDEVAVAVRDQRPRRRRRCRRRAARRARGRACRAGRARCGPARQRFQFRHRQREHDDREPTCSAHVEAVNLGLSTFARRAARPGRLGGRGRLAPARRRRRGDASRVLDAAVGPPRRRVAAANAEAVAADRGAPRRAR